MPTRKISTTTAGTTRRNSGPPEENKRGKNWHSKSRDAYRLCGKCFVYLVDHAAAMRALPKRERHDFKWRAD